MEKMKYESPEFEVIVLKTDQVITDSGWEIGPQPIEEGGLLAPRRSRDVWSDDAP